MDIVKVVEKLLPVTSPFYVDSIHKDDASRLVHLGIEKSYRPHSNCGGVHWKKWLCSWSCFSS